VRRFGERAKAPLRFFRLARFSTVTAYWCGGDIMLHKLYGSLRLERLDLLWMMTANLLVIVL